METSRQPPRAGDDVAQRVMNTLSQKIGPQKFNAWFRHGTRLRLDEATVQVIVANPFVANWIERRYQAEIAQAAQEQTGQARTVTFTIDPTLVDEVGRRQLDTQAALVHREGDGRSRPRPADAPAQPMRHRLEDFVVGQSNKLAYSAAIAFCGAKRPPFNPLFVHGPCGVGKTHLLQGICNAFARRGEGAWRYVTGEQFTNEFITALRQKKFAEFRQRYRRLDLLAIDDVHFLASKKATQEEFLHTFNAIESAGKLVVMASDAHPRMVGQLNEQLISRFVSGMVVKVDAPDKDTRLALARKKAALMNLKVEGDVLDYVASHVRGSVRELEGTLIKLTALASLGNQKITMDLAREALSDHLARTGSAITLADIEAAVAAFFGITPADLHSSRRTKTISVARMSAMFLARRKTTMSYPEIGRYMGKNHSSVVLAVQKMEALLQDNLPVEWSTPAGEKSMPAAQLMDLLAQQIT